MLATPTSAPLPPSKPTLGRTARSAAAAAMAPTAAPTAAPTGDDAPTDELRPSGRFARASATGDVAPTDALKGVISCSGLRRDVCGVTVGALAGPVRMGAPATGALPTKDEEKDEANPAALSAREANMLLPTLGPVAPKPAPATTPAKPEGELRPALAALAAHCSARRCSARAFRLVLAGGAVGAC